MGNTTINGSAVSTNDYSSISDVLAFTRHLMDGQSTYNSTTRPSLSEVTRFLTRASALMNSALIGQGLAVPISQADAKAAVDDWVTAQTVEYIELTKRGVGYSEESGVRTAFKDLSKNARNWAKDNRLAFIRLGVTESHKKSDGLVFTGIDAQEDRVDPDDNSLAQPKFKIGLFDSSFDSDESKL